MQHIPSFDLTVNYNDTHDIYLMISFEKDNSTSTFEILEISL
jgi:hypothetical protein